jgi:hypothetical protein
MNFGKNINELWQEPKRGDWRRGYAARAHRGVRRLLERLTAHGCRGVTARRRRELDADRLWRKHRNLADDRVGYQANPGYGFLK